MKNKEKYLDEILELFSRNPNSAICNWKCKHTLNKKNCNGVSCDDCKKAFKVWLEQEYAEPIKISADERAILRNLKGYKYIVRDMSDTLYLYSEYPQKLEDCWAWTNGKCANLKIFNDLFRFITFNDAQPYSIRELLKVSEDKTDEQAGNIKQFEK